MTAPGDGTTAGPGGHLRASHADRDQVIDGLKAAYVQGRLDQDEFGHRVGQALASRTYAELAALMADLPAGLTDARPPKPDRKRVSRTGIAVTTAGTVAAAGFIVASRFLPDSTPFAIALPFIVIMLTLTSAAPVGWLLIFHAWLENRASSQAAAGLPPGAGGPEARRATQAGPARQPPHTDRDLGITAEAAPRPSGRVRPQIAPAH